MRAEERNLPSAEVQAFLDQFQAAMADHDGDRIRALLKQAIPGYILELPAGKGGDTKKQQAETGVSSATGNIFNTAVT